MPGAEQIVGASAVRPRVMSLFANRKLVTMKTLKALLLALIALSMPMSYATGTTPPSTVNRLFLYEGHTGILVNISGMMDPDACGRQDWFILPNSYNRYKEAYAMLLAAKVSGQRITIVISGCYEGMPQIRHIDLHG